MSRILICGGRAFTDKIYLCTTLDTLNAELQASVCITGGARGADTLGRDWAVTRGIPSLVFPADWDRYRKRAGPIRNQQMLDEGEPDYVIGFPGGTGTAHMLRIAKAAGVKIIRVSMPRERCMSLHVLAKQASMR